MPPLSCVTVTASSAEVSLQTLLNHTAERLLQIPAVIEAEATACHSATEPPLLTLHIKGVDSSTGHSQYKMADSEDDSQLLLTSLVPLRLTAEDG